MKTIILFLMVLSFNLFAQDYALKWSSYLGGSGNDEISNIATDKSGNTYILGYTNSNDYPTSTNAYQRDKSGGADIFLTKLDVNQNVVWSTYIGGRSNDAPHGLAIANDGIWIVGETVSSNYPTVGATNQNGFAGGSGDVIVSKFSFDGNLLFSTYFGGDGYDAAAGATLDGQNNLWIIIRTNSNYLSVTQDAVKKALTGAYDVFILKLSNNGQIMYSSYLGGSNSDYGLKLAYSKSLDNVVAVGFTDSGDYPIVGNNPLQNKKFGYQDQYDGFISYFDMNNNLVWSSFFGSKGNDYALNVDFDKEDNLLVRFYTTSSGLPVQANSFQKNLIGNVNNYILKLNKNKEIEWSTYIGGSLTDGADNLLHKFGGLAIDDENNILITGFTNSADFPTTANAYSKVKSSSNDSYISIFNEQGSLEYSTFLGGNNDDNGRGIDTYKNKIIVVGITSSADFPITSDGLKTNFNNSSEAFISVFETNNLICNPVINTDNGGFMNLPLKTNRDMAHDSYVDLTDFKAFDKGYMFCREKVNTSLGFVSNFWFTVSHGVDKIDVLKMVGDELASENSAPGADGLTFVILGDIPNSGTAPGGGIGYAGIPNGIAIELDLFQNDDNNDPNGNHLAIQIPSLDGRLSPVHNSRNTLLMKDNILEIKSDSSSVYYGRVEYVGNTLRVYLDTTQNFVSPVAVLDNFVLPDYLLMENNDIAYLGLTSSTGQSVELHTITHWDICSYASPPTDVNYDEPEQGLSVYPNPTDDYINIALPDSKAYKQVQIVLSDLLGNIVLEKEISSVHSSIRLPVHRLIRGLYNCQIISEGQEIYRTQFIRR